MRSRPSKRYCAWIGLFFALSTFGLPAARAEEPEPKQRYWTTQWSFEDVDVARLTRQLGSIGIDLGVELEGTVSVEFDVGVPWTSITDAAEYRFSGSLTSPRLTVDGVRLKDLTTVVEYQKGVAKLSQLSATVLDPPANPANGSGVDRAVGGASSANVSRGEIDGEAKIELVPRGDVHAKLEIDQLSLESLSRLIQKWIPRQPNLIPQGGLVSTKIEMRVPLDAIARLDQYELTGSARARDVSLPGLPTSDFELSAVSIHDRVLTLDGVSLTAKADPAAAERVGLMGDASIRLDDMGSFEFNVSGDDVPTSTAATLVLGPSLGQTLFDGKLDFIIQGKGQSQPTDSGSRWTIGGAVASPQLSVAGLDLGTLEHAIRFTDSEFTIEPVGGRDNVPETFEIERIESTYAIKDDAFELTRFAASLFHGEVQGSAIVPFHSARDLTGNTAGNTTGNLSARLNLNGLQPKFDLKPLTGVAVRLNTTLSGDLDWSCPINGLSEPFRHRGKASLSIADVRANDIGVGELRLEVTASESSSDGDELEWSMIADGTLFDGTVHGEAVASMQPGDRWADVRGRLGQTELTFDDIHLGDLASWWLGNRSDFSANLSGSVSLGKPLVPINGDSFSIESLDDTKIDLELNRVRYRSELLSRSMKLACQVDGGLVEIESLAGDYGGGTVRVRGRVTLLDRQEKFHPRADLRASMSRVQLDRGLWFLGDQAASLEGRASASMTIAGYGESIRVRGNVDGSELVLFGMPLGNAHSGLMADANLDRLSWNVQFPTVRSSAGGGQVEGELAVSSPRRGGRGVDLESRWRTRRVDFSRLSDQIGSSSSLVQGEITGELSLQGRSVQSIDDLSGRYRFDFGETRGTGVPGLVGISRLLGPASLTSQTFREGEVKGLVGRGAVVIEEFWLASESVLIRADGKYYLRSGRMDLEALVATGNYQDVAADFARLAQQYALRAILPAAAILDISDLLCDRTLVVSVRGTTSAPIVRLLPVETFREEAARFLLREGQRVILAGASAGTAEGVFGK